MTVFITASERTHRGELTEVCYYLVYADNWEEALRKTRGYVSQLIPHVTACEWANALEIDRLDEKQILCRDLNAYYAQEVIGMRYKEGVDGRIVFARSAAEARRKLPPYSGDGVIALSILPKITDIIL